MAAPRTLQGRQLGIPLFYLTPQTLSLPHPPTLAPPTTQPQVQKWTRPPRLKAANQASPNILECDRWIVPVHQGIHWTCAVVDLRRKVGGWGGG